MKHFLTYSLLALTFYSCGKYQKILKKEEKGEEEEEKSGRGGTEGDTEEGAGVCR